MCAGRSRTHRATGARTAAPRERRNCRPPLVHARDHLLPDVACVPAGLPNLGLPRGGDRAAVLGFRPETGDRIAGEGAGGAETRLRARDRDLNVLAKSQGHLAAMRRLRLREIDQRVDRGPSESQRNAGGGNRGRRCHRQHVERLPIVRHHDARAVDCPRVRHPDVGADDVVTPAGPQPTGVPVADDLDVLEAMKTPRTDGRPCASSFGCPPSISRHISAETELKRQKLAQDQRPLIRQPAPSRTAVPVGWPLPLPANFLPAGMSARIASRSMRSAKRDAPPDEIAAHQATEPSSSAKASMAARNAQRMGLRTAQARGSQSCVRPASMSASATGSGRSGPTAKADRCSRSEAEVSRQSRAARAASDLRPSRQGQARMLRRSFSDLSSVRDAY